MEEQVELHITRGIQGSGKTTLARTLAALDGGRVVGRDHVRRLIGVNGLGTRKQEDEVTKIQVRLIHEGLRSGQNVYVDDMNLKAIYVKRLLGIAEYFKARVVFHDLARVPLETCLERNRARSADERINDQVVINNYNRFVKPLNGGTFVNPTVAEYDTKYLPFEKYVQDESQHKAILVDIDGTVALHDGIRGHHDYDKVNLDLPNWPVITAVRSMINRGYTPLFVSGRPDSCEADTRMWLSKYINTAGHLYMRRTGDHREDSLIKYELFNKHIRNNFNVALAFDDRDQVVRMYREIGLTVLQVAEGNF